MLNDGRVRRIAVDARNIEWRDGTGIARYRAGLAAALSRLPVELRLLGDGTDADARPAWRDLSRSLRAHHPAISDRRGWHLPDLYRLAQRRFSLTGSLLELTLPEPPAIVHWSHPLPIHVRGAANIYTVHDLIPITAPHLTGMSRRRHVRLLRNLARAAAHFVTVSETVGHELRDHFGIADAQTSCCYQAVDPGQPGALPAGLTQGGYLLALGRVESRKNIERLLRAHRRAAVGLPLVIAGPDGHWASPSECARVHALLKAPDVMRLAWQHDATVAALVGGARAVLMPSLAEGFGLPVIEAMAMSVPTLAASTGAGAEIAGDAALQVDPNDVDAIADAIRRLTRDADLRTRLIRRGTARAELFSANCFTARLAALYERFW
ncbi:glycosyltransferase family 1 protein [Sphingomonas sp. ST-64]|uniref:Glycosyltransferase family 1 protein n=1 Tax=Sphingomonas plantiphila TaxID=3163295 RepID=A0ABW8YMR9_9SPHN